MGMAEQSQDWRAKRSRTPGVMRPDENASEGKQLNHEKRMAGLNPLSGLELAERLLNLQWHGKHHQSLSDAAVVREAARRLMTA
jgi:hypothetical protein